MESNISLIVMRETSDVSLRLHGCSQVNSSGKILIPLTLRTPIALMQSARLATRLETRGEVPRARNRIQNQRCYQIERGNQSSIVLISQSKGTILKPINVRRPYPRITGTPKVVLPGITFGLFKSST